MYSLLITTIVLIFITILFCLLVAWDEIFRDLSTHACGIGMCAVNISTGEFTCPEGDEQINIDPNKQVCSSKQACTNSTLPCVYESLEQGTVCPGDPEYTGLCSGECRCSNLKICPDWANVFFIPETRTGLITTFIQSIEGTYGSTLPLIIGTSSQVGFCGLSTDRLQNMWPYDQCIRGVLGFNESDSLWYCMNTTTQCPNGQSLVRTLTGDYSCRQL